MGTYLASISLLTCVHLFAPGYKDTENFFVPRLWKGDISPIAEFHASEIFFEQPEIPVDMTYFLAYYFPVTRLLDFFLGVFAAKLIIERQWRNTRLVWPRRFGPSCECNVARLMGCLVSWDEN